MVRSAAALALLAPLAAAKTTEKDLNQWLVEAEYAVRGEILDRSEELQKQLDAGEKLPFEKIVPCNIGNPQALGQKPLSFNRQVLSLVTNPDMLADGSRKALFPADAGARAEKYTSKIGGGIGAYTNSQGLTVVRQEVARAATWRLGRAAQRCGGGRVQRRRGGGGRRRAGAGRGGGNTQRSRNSC